MPTPQTGTWRALAFGVTLTGDTNWAFNGTSVNMTDVFKSLASDANNGTKTAPDSYSTASGAHSSPNTAAIVLNPGTVDEETLDYNSLPAGFTVLGVNIKLRTKIGISGQGAAGQPIKFYYNNAEVGAYINILLANVDVTYTHTVSPVPSTLATFFGTNFGFNCDGSGLGGSSLLRIDSCWIEGTYELSYTISNITPDPLDYNAADLNPVVSIDGTDLDNLDLTNWTMKYEDDDGDTVTITIPAGNLTLISLILIELVWPGDLLTDFFGTATFTIYSGSVALGTLSVIYATGSGIYQFVLNKRNDTLYDRVNDTTEDVAIPEPFGETGFIGG